MVNSQKSKEMYVCCSNFHLKILNGDFVQLMNGKRGEMKEGERERWIPRGEREKEIMETETERYIQYTEWDNSDCVLCMQVLIERNK